MNLHAPSEQEQQEVMEYVLKRPLVRPEITFKSFFFKLFNFFMVCICVGFLSIFILESLGAFSLLGKEINEFKTKYLSLFYFIYTVIFVATITLILSRFICIDCVKLYQHYASEYTRRCCLCKPTCSEYAIIVLKKYGTFIGILKIINRLFFICRGTIYHEHRP